jgi:hypothetical protein
MVKMIYVTPFFCNLFGNPLRRCNTFGISLVFVLFLLCPDVVAPAIEWSLCTIEVGSGKIVKLNIILYFMFLGG